MYKRPYKPFRAKTVKEKSIENIKDFSKNKILYALEKPHSPQSIVIVEDLNDPWFVYVKYFKTKSGVVTDSSMMIKSDIETLLIHLKRLGWELKK